MTLLSNENQSPNVEPNPAHDRLVQILTAMGRHEPGVVHDISPSASEVDIQLAAFAIACGEPIGSIRQFDSSDN